VKLATFNINNVNKRLPNLLRWLKQAEPDIACLQELKCEARDFPEAAFRRAGYSAVWEGQQSWNGVAILSRGPPPNRYAPAITRRSCWSPGPIYRGCGRRSADRVPLPSKRKIRNRGQSSTTRWSGFRALLAMRLSCRSKTPSL